MSINVDAMSIYATTFPIGGKISPSNKAKKEEIRVVEATGNSKKEDPFGKAAEYAGSKQPNYYPTYNKMGRLN